MKFYFRLKSIPELAELSKSERRIAWYQCRKQIKSNWKLRTGTALSILLGLGVGLVGLRLVMTYSPLSPLLTFFIAGFACGALIIGVTEYLRTIIATTHIRPYLRAYLEAQAATNEGGAAVDIEYASAPFEDENSEVEATSEKREGTSD